MDDGSVILIAHGHGFKVYKGILAAQSPVFRDMFVSSGGPEGEMLDKCPVVHLSDSAEDLRYFLRAIMPVNQPMLHRSKTDPKISAAAIFAIARLAHKYQADELQRQALACIQEYYITSFDAWESKGQVGDVPFETSDAPVYAIAAVALARLTNTPSILPLAFYDCCRLGGRLLEGWTHEDGSVERLSDEDLRRCLDSTHARHKP